MEKNSIEKKSYLKSEFKLKSKEDNLNKIRLKFFSQGNLNIGFFNKIAFFQQHQIPFCENKITYFQLICICIFLFFMIRANTSNL